VSSRLTQGLRVWPPTRGQAQGQRVPGVEPKARPSLEDAANSPDGCQPIWVARREAPASSQKEGASIDTGCALSARHSLAFLRGADSPRPPGLRVKKKPRTRGGNEGLPGADINNTGDDAWLEVKDQGSRIRGSGSGIRNRKSGVQLFEK
jgi:hypothetical protein